MEKGRWSRRRPFKHLQHRSRVEPSVAVDLPGNDSLDLRCGPAGGVSIVREFLNIWGDLRRQYGDKEAADANQVGTTVPTVQTDKMTGSRRVEGGGKAYEGKSGRKRLVMSVDRPLKKTNKTCAVVTGTVQSSTVKNEEDTTVTSQSKNVTCTSSVVEEGDLSIMTSMSMRKTLLELPVTGVGHCQDVCSVIVSGDQAATNIDANGVLASAMTKSYEDSIVDVTTVTAQDDVLDNPVVPSREMAESRDKGDIEMLVGTSSCQKDIKGKLEAVMSEPELFQSLVKKKKKKKKSKQKPVPVSPTSIERESMNSVTKAAAINTVSDSPSCSLARLGQEGYQQVGDLTEGAGQSDVEGDELAPPVPGGDGPKLYFPINQACDENNNQIVAQNYSSCLSTIIDAGEGDTSGEDVPFKPATTVTLKHPLEHEWTFWFFYPDRNRTWEENLKTIKTVSTIEDFWAVHNWIEPPSRLQPRADYSLFKVGISPDWEDLANRKGGRWVVNCGRQGVDKDWMEVIMAMVGQQFGEGQDKQVNGAVVSLRNRGDKVAIWVREVDGSDKVGDILSVVLGRTGVFKVHKKQMW
eukprot:GFUD01042696.1.p1 GENE.GFUD01042696.1~~GFUD01042696.1.p1  ORF type:complete len:579 (+),score=177.97 GFUD01042696.1:60-1796(+)